MKWMERLQNRLAITRQESLAILILSGLYLGGLTVQHVREGAAPAVVAAVPAALSSAAAVRDSVVVTAPSTAPDSAEVERAKPQKPASVPARLDLNAASAAELETLPRIGPKLAERIIAYRAAHGPFRRVRDLNRVSGIGDKMMALLEPLLYVESGR